MKVTGAYIKKSASKTRYSPYLMTKTLVQENAFIKKTWEKLPKYPKFSHTQFLPDTHEMQKWTICVQCLDCVNVEAVLITDANAGLEIRCNG